MTQERVTDAGSFVPASFRSVVSSGNHVLSNIITTNITIDASVVISGVVGITPNAVAISRGRPIQHPGSYSPLNEKTEYGWLLPSGFCGMSSTDLLKEQVEHTSITAAGSGDPDVTGKIISIGIVNSWVLDRVLKVSRVPDLSLDPQKCIKAMSSAEVSGDTKLMVNSWNLDPVFKLSPATGLLDLISDGYPLSRGYGSGSLDPFGSGIRGLGIIGTGHPTQAKGGVVPVFLGSISCDYRSGGVCAMRDGVCGWSFYEIEAESLFCYDQGAGVVPLDGVTVGLLSSVDGFNSVSSQVRHYGLIHVQSDSSNVLISGSVESSSGLVRSCRPAGKALRFGLVLTISGGLFSVLGSHPRVVTSLVLFPSSLLGCCARVVV